MVTQIHLKVVTEGWEKDLEIYEYMLFKVRGLDVNTLVYYGWRSDRKTKPCSTLTLRVWDKEEYPEIK